MSSLLRLRVCLHALLTVTVISKHVNTPSQNNVSVTTPRVKAVTTLKHIQSQSSEHFTQVESEQ